jgi:serine/threonine protein kinase
MIGKTLDGRYKIIQELGRGGFGETFVAIDIKLHNSRCVVKRLNPFSEDRERYSSGGEALAAVQAYIKSLPSPISPPISSYVPQHKLVNTYSDDLETKPTKKLSIAIKVSHVLNFSKTTVIARIYLFLQRHLNVIQRIDNLGIRLQIWRDIFCIYSLYIGLPLVTIVTLSAFHSFWQLFSGVSLFISLPIGLTFVIFIREITIIRLIGYVSLVIKMLDHRLNNNLRYLFIKPFLEGNLTVPLTSLFCAGSSWVSLAISFIGAGIFAWTDGLFLTVLYITLNIIEGGFPKPSNNYKNFLWRIGNGSSFFIANLTAWSIESNLFSLKIIDSPKGNPFTSMSISQWLLLTVAQFISYIIIKSLIASLLIDLPVKSHRTIERSKE